MHHHCGVTSHTCQWVDRSHGAFQGAFLEKLREEEERGGKEESVGEGIGSGSCVLCALRAREFQANGL